MNRPESLKGFLTNLFMVYNVLGRLLWCDGLHGAEVVIRHRGSPGDVKTIRGETIKEIKRGFFIHSSSPGEETVIPLHRIQEVRNHGETIWKRPGKA